MMQIALIGVGAGAASALLFASFTTGSWLAVVLFYLAPLPIMIAGLGWSHWGAAAAAAAGTIIIGLVFSPVYFMAFLAGVCVPAWWLSYLTLLARPSGTNGTATLEWYPPGRLVAWAAALGALVVLAAMPFIGLDAESFRANLSQALNEMLVQQTAGSATALGIPDVKRLVSFLVEVLPPSAAVIAALTNTLNLWLAGRIVRLSGRLTRPWPDIQSMTFPATVSWTLAVALALTFAGGMVAIVATVVSAALLMAYGFLGFAVLHSITQGMSARGFLLGGAYAAVLVIAWPLIGLCLLGLADVMLDLRGRAAARRGPPRPPART